jgi:NAD(P)-dependent dehydrogenase (short-subunit alcohol dehydrogenase family)
VKASQLFDLSGTLALVTGAGSGLGRQFAITVANAGAIVFLSGRRSGPLEQTAALIREAGGVSHQLSFDIVDAAEVEVAFEKIGVMGGIDIVVNNAGIPSSAALIETTVEEWENVIDTNLKGAWLMARAAARLMIAQGRGGSIINVSSILADAVQKGTGAYAASKAALSHLTRVMALEWAKHAIRVNAIEPGYYLTEINSRHLEAKLGATLRQRVPQRRFGRLDELDGALLLLASRASSYMTGSVIKVDGGLSLPVVG